MFYNSSSVDRFTTLGGKAYKKKPEVNFNSALNPFRDVLPARLPNEDLTAFSLCFLRTCTLAKATTLCYFNRGDRSPPVL